jgi:L,D-transpeptidase ErfK/SrfK
MNKLLSEKTLLGFKKPLASFYLALSKSLNKQFSYIKKIALTMVRYRMMLSLVLFIAALPSLLRCATSGQSGWFHQDAVASQQDIEKAGKKLQTEIEALDRKLSAKTPRGHYLVINSAANEFALYKGHKLIKRDKCSTGSYILLKNGDQQQWMFKTPKGRFSIQGKTTSPVWKKPDWAFVEEGLPVPSATHHTRFEYGVLGDYALSLGDGYLIHGTLYQRFLGLPVTHGCIRLGDENLELVYRSLSLGSKVFIF